MKKEPKSLQQILRKAPSIKKLLQEADADHNRLIQLRQMVPAELASHCVSVHQQKGTMTIYLSSPAWASRMRLISKKLADKLGVRYISCKVQASRTQPKITNKITSRARHSDLAADLIESSIGHSSDPELDAILKRLAQAVRPKH
ncbi:DciA family protein [Solemya velum gill symbiont]|uniref:DUF721 domain-containing protein n=1 Tax=Solemya velum gill symbiont TaxID=2340 RepID=A0A0B0H7T3_SOVGS|nr:DciA family protein [Solemya velum gill symbiont]KHF26243.1 hypothetical protein JV46_21720 [Solemya velum gill symbiont]OOY35954.1 hypothetical protein BOV88_02635 [Solemya velum gill symbiont]OOY38794.1 hypothetical protein BOV89_00805 [Solemya velum gill symbiont]OOY40723.1 hypothetical protein BOV90_02705 [Solemya velum gill symbiont]OOY41257.1 hypothetical protein BOV91_12435 [Solemya velum gill symbiont]